MESSSSSHPSSAAAPKPPQASSKQFPSPTSLNQPQLYDYYKPRAISSSPATPASSSSVSRFPMVHGNSYNNLLGDCIIYISYLGMENYEIIELCKALGGVYVAEYSEIVQYVITDGWDYGTVQQAQSDGKLVVSYRWLVDCAREKCKTDPSNYNILT